MRTAMIVKRATIFVAFIFFHSISYCQVWERTFNSNPGAVVVQIKESYDEGFFVGSKIPIGNQYRIGWIIKTDVNGNTLWEKKLGNGTRGWAIWGFDTTADGGLILVGYTDTLNNSINVNPYILKLDACGNDEWCRIYCPGNEHFDYGRQIVSLSDNSYAALFTLWLNGEENQMPWLFSC